MATRSHQPLPPEPWLASKPKKHHRGSIVVVMGRVIYGSSPEMTGRDSLCIQLIDLAGTVTSPGTFLYLPEEDVMPIREFARRLRDV